MTSGIHAPSQATAVEQFLLACLRSRWDASALSEVRAQSERSAEDWIAFRQLAMRENVAPLLYASLRGRGILPPSVEGDLASAYFHTAARNTLMLRQLEELLIRLDAAHVPAIALKGAALVESVYGNAAVRPMVDLDLLVKEQDVPAALACMRDAGFSALHPRGYKAEIIHQNPAPGSPPVELHWNLFVPPYFSYALPMAWFWETAIPVETDTGQSIMVLGPEAQLLHLCGHLYVHHWAPGDSPRLLWLHDVAELIVASPQLDWGRVIEVARQGGLVTSLKTVTQRLVQAWHLDLPGNIAAQLESLEPGDIELRLIASLAQAPPSLFGQLKLDLSLLPTWRARAHFLWRNLFPPAGYMRELYGAGGVLGVPRQYLRRWLEMLT